MARRTKRTDGRYAVTTRIEQPDGTRRRSFFYGRTQAEAQAKSLLNPATGRTSRCRVRDCCTDR